MSSRAQLGDSRGQFTTLQASGSGSRPPEEERPGRPRPCRSQRDEQVATLRARIEEAERDAQARIAAAQQRTEQAEAAASSSRCRGAQGEPGRRPRCGRAGRSRRGCQRRWGHRPRPATARRARHRRARRAATSSSPRGSAATTSSSAPRSVATTSCRHRPVPARPPHRGAGPRSATRCSPPRRAQRDEMLTEARERSTGMVAEAQQKKAAILEELGRERRLLERKIEELRGFERDYRSRLHAYIQGQLAELKERQRREPDPMAREPTASRLPRSRSRSARADARSDEGPGRVPGPSSSRMSDGRLAQRFGVETCRCRPYPSAHQSGRRGSQHTREVGHHGQGALSAAKQVGARAAATARKAVGGRSSRRRSATKVRSRWYPAHGRRGHLEGRPRRLAAPAEGGAPAAKAPREEPATKKAAPAAKTGAKAPARKAAPATKKAPRRRRLRRRQRRTYDQGRAREEATKAAPARKAPREGRPTETAPAKQRGTKTDAPAKKPRAPRRRRRPAKAGRTDDPDGHEGGTRDDDHPSEQGTSDHCRPAPGAAAKCVPAVREDESPWTAKELRDGPRRAQERHRAAPQRARQRRERPRRPHARLRRRRGRRPGRRRGEDLRARAGDLARPTTPARCSSRPSTRSSGWTTAPTASASPAATRSANFVCRRLLVRPYVCHAR